MKKVFIDGKAGTTGLRIYERLENRTDIELISLSDELRKDPEARKAAINSSDITFLCLPDDASRQAVTFVENENTVIIDTSTAHRTDPRFVYGFPELDDRLEERLKASKRIAVPGCHASGFIALIYPLVKNGFLPADALVSCHSITGYSGGGKKMIGEYEESSHSSLLNAPRQYGISQSHKHLKEMKAVTGLNSLPLFCPIVAPFYSGMEVTIPLFASQLNGKSIDGIKQLYKSSYNSPIVFYADDSDEEGFLSAAALSGKDSMQISVHGNEERILLVARYDNLGKGASGAALECMNIILGCDRAEGLEI